MSDSLISKICDVNYEHRDLLVDELNDEIENGSFKAEEIRSITMNLLRVLPSETDETVHESVLNLLSSIYTSSICVSEIERYVIDHIQEMKPGSLVHAFSILSESKLKERKAIFFKFSRSENVAIQELTIDYLSKM
ncbi:MAG: hypothetical protein JAY67_22775 [Candidatus Thiodiazotropha taylori]|nr:hypothetical protein [Candidatus Thiodiazotropha taylori]